VVSIEDAICWVIVKAGRRNHMRGGMFTSYRMPEMQFRENEE